MPKQPDHLTDAFEYPLMQAIFGRRARRFGLGMEIPSGPLAFTSRRDPQPLSELERTLLIAAATGVSGWNFGVPFGPRTPNAHAEYTLRFTGRTLPTAGGFGTPVLFFTDDSGTYVTNTRDVQPAQMRELNAIDDDGERILAVCRAHTVRLSEKRLELPAAPPHMIEPNFWMVNRPGSTLFMPMADASEQVLSLMAMLVANGYVIQDDGEKRPAGDLQRFVRSGLLEERKTFPLSVLVQGMYEANCAELAFMGHNIVLALQAIGLGGCTSTASTAGACSERSLSRA
jgi:hypothetical protein